jgi:hypothetical protein
VTASATVPPATRARQDVPGCPLGLGSAWGYRRGCRCDGCTTGNSDGLAAARARKERYRGSCIVCGKPTTGCKGPGRAPNRCASHSAALTNMRRRGTGPSEQRVLAFVGDGERRFVEIVRGLGIGRGPAGSMLNRLVGYGLLERPRRGVYRSASGSSVAGTL